VTAEHEKAVIAVIRTLGFIGNTHYCPHCMNEFHHDRGQHEPDCETLAFLQADAEWWSELEWRLK
jgi:hypothetical protein